MNKSICSSEVYAIRLDILLLWISILDVTAPYSAVFFNEGVSRHESVVVRAIIEEAVNEGIEACDWSILVDVAKRHCQRGISIRLKRAARQVLQSRSDGDED